VGGPLGHLGPGHVLDGHGLQVPQPPALVHGPKAALAKHSAHLVRLLERGLGVVPVVGGRAGVGHLAAGAGFVGAGRLDHGVGGLDEEGAGRWAGG